MSYKVNRKGFLQYFGIPHHEYWSWWFLVIPIWPMWIWYMLRLKQITWFTAVNPGMEDSGFLGESKIRILNSLPNDYLPQTIFIKHQQSFQEIRNTISFPLIAKPDIGGRGRKVEILKSEIELKNYHQIVGEDYMIQELISHPLEMGVFYIKIPNETKGRIVSIAEKGFLKVLGNGINSIAQLMEQDFRAKQQIERLAKQLDLSKVLDVNEEMILEPIGNHCRGTSFLNRNEMIHEELVKVFDEISSQIEGFYYGRFDLKVKSWEDLYAGKHIYILELNGLTSDAAHIFDPQCRLRDAYATQIRNCQWAFQIAKQNLKMGAKTTPALELFRKSKGNI